MQNFTSRRDLLKSAALLPLASFAAPEKAPDKKRAVRFAYIGDTHITPDAKPMKAVAACLHHLQNQADKPAFILHGGDVIMDALGRDKAAVAAQWQAWQQVVKAECSLPIDYCIGNHDIWGLPDAKADARYGKAWVQEVLGLANRYRSVARNGWHIIILDSVQTNPDGSWYTAHLDAPQFAWLEKELASIPATTPVLLLSHIPLLAACAFYDPNTVKGGHWAIPGSWVHTDATRLIALFHQHPNVKLALSGHMHLLDRVEYNNVTYCCNGAVSGNWWSTDTYHETPAGYALIDLYTDGSYERTYVKQTFA
ncbi:metallophosphoesterase family protein [Fibrella aquatilis]|uniref:Metallophosphoesterase n=1 Tax=Fibrella aquatilis TaxID=2817059 RepID=A0A939G349_9BACT|nr:metallophosphoesterase [Fibrella aquatilis]MBO0929580.1 metallophosphoesterase [Fibrella aquatilis]